MFLNSRYPSCTWDFYLRSQSLACSSLHLTEKLASLPLSWFECLPVLLLLLFALLGVPPYFNIHRASRDRRIDSRGFQRRERFQRKTVGMSRRSIEVGEDKFESRIRKRRGTTGVQALSPWRRKQIPYLLCYDAPLNEIYLKTLTIVLILYQLGNGLRTLNTLSQATGYPNYKFSICNEMVRNKLFDDLSLDHFIKETIQNETAFWNFWWIDGWMDVWKPKQVKKNNF